MVRLNPKRASSTKVCQAEKGSETSAPAAPSSDEERDEPVRAGDAAGRERPVERGQDAEEEHGERERRAERALHEREAPVREGVRAAPGGGRLVHPAGERRGDPARAPDVPQVEDEQRGLDRVLQADSRRGRPRGRCAP